MSIRTFLPKEIWTRIYSFLTTCKKPVMVQDPIDMCHHLLKDRTIKDLSGSLLCRWRRCVSTSCFLPGFSNINIIMNRHFKDLFHQVKKQQEDLFSRKLEQSICFRKHTRYDQDGRRVENVAGVMSWAGSYFLILSHDGVDYVVRRS